MKNLHLYLNIYRQYLFDKRRNEKKYSLFVFITTKLFLPSKLPTNVVKKKGFIAINIESIYRKAIKSQSNKFTKKTSNTNHTVKIKEKNTNGIHSYIIYIL